jgi:hypothetical protein
MSSETDVQRLYALSEDEILFQLDADTLAGAEQHCRAGHVLNPTVDDATLRALVQHNAYESHGVEISVVDDDIYIGCTCEHLGPGICEHVGAVLLKWVQGRAEFAGVQPAHESESRDAFQQNELLAGEYNEILSQQTINELRELARRRGIEIRGTRKDPIVQELAAKLSTPQANRSYLKSTSKLVQELLVYLNLTLAPGYGFTGENIVGKLARKHANLPRRALHEQIAELAEQGLLLKFEQDNATYYLLPQAVRLCLPPRPGLVPLYPEQQLDQLEVRERPATALIQSLYSVWNYIVEQRPRRNAARRRLPVEDNWPQFVGWDHLPEEIKEITERNRTSYNLYNVSVSIPPAPYHLKAVDRNVLHRQTGFVDEEIEFYYILLESLDAIGARAGEPVAYIQETFEQLLSMAPSMQTYALLQTWLHTTAWSEMDILLRSAEHIRLRRSLNYSTFRPEELYHEWRLGRESVLRFLSTIPEDRWVSVNGFLRTIYEIYAGLLHAHSGAAVWWLESRKTKRQFGTTFEDWEESIGHFILALLEGPLAWFGAISLGYKDGKAVAFKITPVGSFALQRRPTIADAELPDIPRDAVQIGDDLTIALVPGLAPAQLHDLLHVIGTLEETTPERFVYRINAEGVLLALEEGQTIESLLHRIHEWCGLEIPATWQRRMLDWSENYGKLHIYDDITLIELADDYVLQELMSNTALRDHLVYEFSPRLVAVRPDAVNELVQEMEKRGYTPYVE